MLPRETSGICFQNFPSIPCSSNEVWSRLNVTSEFFIQKKCDIHSSIERNSAENHSFDRYKWEERLDFFFTIFHPHPCPGMRYEVGKDVISTMRYDLIFQLTESGDDSFNRCYLVEYLKFFSEFFVHTCCRKKKLKTILALLQMKFKRFLKYR